MAEVALSGVTKRFGTARAPSTRSDLTIADGEFVVLLGPTGAGKTTTLRLVAGLEQPGRRHGSASPAATSTRSSRPPRDVTFVFQQYSLYPHLTVYDNLAFPLRSPARRVPEPRSTPRVAEIARALRIAGKLQNRATQLSGGEMQRVAIGRALVRRPADLPDGRAALLARRQAPRRPPARAEAHPAGSRRDHPLRHARPDRGDDDGEPHRHPRGRPADPGRHAARDLREPAQPLCRRPARPAGDQPDPAGPAARRQAPPAGTATIGARTEHLQLARATGGNGRS